MPVVKLKITMKKILLLFVLAGACFAGISVDWSIPATTDTPFVIPFSNITVDGVLTDTEWASGFCLPIRSQYHISNAKRQWKGPQDAGMEFYAAWNEKGLFFGAIVADNEVINHKPLESAYEQDCIEIFVDGRSISFMKPPYSKGCYQILVKPPIDRQAPIAEVFGRNKISGMQIAGVKTITGYDIELFVPWSAFPEIKKVCPGIHIAIQAMLDDYDSQDLDKVQPLSLSYQGKKELYRSPQHFVHCVCEEKIQPVFSIECSPLMLEKQSIPVAVETFSMAGDIDSIKIRIENPQGIVLAEKKPKLIKYTSPWPKAIRATASFDVEKLQGDVFVISAIVGRKNAEYTCRKTVIYLGNIAEEILSEIRKANIKKLSQSDPFKAAGFLAVGSCYEKIKYAVETADVEKLTYAVREIAARINALNGKQLKKTHSLIDLLVLTENPESQVVVEYPLPEVANITFYWGSVPLVTVNVRKFADQNLPKQAAKEKITGFVDLLEDVNPAGPVVIAGLPARASSWSYMFFYFNIEKFDPERQILVAIPSSRTVYAVDTGKIDYVDAEAATIVDGASETIKKQVEKYIRSKKIHLLPVDEALKKNSVLIATEKDIPQEIKKFKAYQVSIVKQSLIRIPYNDMLVSVSHPSRWVAEEAAKLVIAGKPVSIQDVDKIRKTLVNEFAFSTRSSENVKRQGFIYCGDLHSHSRFSDGKHTPVGMALQSMTCCMDFLALTDHNTIDGALITSTLLSKHGFDYTFIVGQEITTKNFHFNAYPLKKVIQWTLAPEQIISLAHQQSAIIQWNHPGWTHSMWELERIDEVPSDIGLDGWEHIPFHYYDWKKNDTLPSLIGSTDTHDGTFSNPERTIIFADGCQEKDVVEAIKNKRTILVSPSRGSDFMYGENSVIGEAWDILLEAQELKNVKKQHISNMLKNADLPALLKEKYSKN
ncbi:MAG TPA: sugar-binding protein [bacterium]|nr:sugar-binding protein [bacterium]HOL48994.1 sugar-binding protein [bacterium]HPO52039.1 sugar-binding protein [bacterium]